MRTLLEDQLFVGRFWVPELWDSLCSGGTDEDWKGSVLGCPVAPEPPCAPGDLPWTVSGENMGSHLWAECLVGIALLADQLSAG